MYALAYLSGGASKVAVRANTLCNKHSIDLMGHRWVTEETLNEPLVGVVAQSSRLRKSDDADKKQRMQSKKHKWNVLRLRRTSSSFDVFHYIDALFRKEEQIVVDNTNMCSWEYANYVKLATKKGYTVRIICMSAGLHDETLVKTLAERNSHGVDAETIARMKDRYEPDVAEELA